MQSEALSRDHKPEEKDEEERILRCGGRIDAFRDPDNEDEEIGPRRVWLQE